MIYHQSSTNPQLASPLRDSPTSPAQRTLPSLTPQTHHSWLLHPRSGGLRFFGRAIETPGRWDPKGGTPPGGSFTSFTPPGVRPSRSTTDGIAVRCCSRTVRTPSLIHHSAFLWGERFALRLVGLQGWPSHVTHLTTPTPCQWHGYCRVSAHWGYRHQGWRVPHKVRGAGLRNGSLATHYGLVHVLCSVRPRSVTDCEGSRKHSSPSKKFASRWSRDRSVVCGVGRCASLARGDAGAIPWIGFGAGMGEMARGEGAP